jgi:hypothetical protein
VPQVGFPGLKPFIVVVIFTGLKAGASTENQELPIKSPTQACCGGLEWGTRQSCGERGPSTPLPSVRMTIKERILCSTQNKTDRLNYLL